VRAQVGHVQPGPDGTTQTIRHWPAWPASSSMTVTSAIPGKAAGAALASPVLSGVINGSLSISVYARISGRLAAGRVITLAWRKGHCTFPVARPGVAGARGWSNRGIYRGLRNWARRENRPIPQRFTAAREPLHSDAIQLTEVQRAQVLDRWDLVLLFIKPCHGSPDSRLPGAAAELPTVAATVPKQPSRASARTTQSKDVNGIRN